jgi:tight adherence protein B
VIRLLLAAAAAIGTGLCFVEATSIRTTVRDGRRARLVDRLATGLARAGLDGVSPAQFVGTVAGLAAAGTLTSAAVIGPGVPALALGCLGGMVPVTGWRARRRAARRAARDHWPQLVDELRVLTSSAGRPLPQALIEAGLHGPEELRPAFVAARREWALTTDFERTVVVLADRLADATADATLATLLVAHEVGGDVDPHLRALAEDRRADLRDRREATSRQAGARLARLFVIVVPAGMAFAGLSVGDGAAAYRSAWGQVAVVGAMALVAACWWWAGRIMRLPEDERVLAS